MTPIDYDKDITHSFNNTKTPKQWRTNEDHVKRHIE